MSHYEQRLQSDLTDIRSRVATLSARVEGALKNAVHALLTGNRKLAYATVLGDSRINRDVREIDRRCHRFIVRHLPSAGHLRLMSTVMRTGIQLERIGDYAVTIAREGVRLSKPPSGAMAREVDLVASHAMRMLSQAVDALNDLNEDAARATMGMGDKLEGTLDNVYADLMAESDAGKVRDLISLFVVFNMVKRVLDQAKNICEETVFAASGQSRGERVHDVLFVDRDNAGMSQMAEAVARRSYPKQARFHSAGQAAAPDLDPATKAFLETHGYDTSELVPKTVDPTHDELAQYFVIVVLQGSAASYFDDVPFHTSVLEWDLGEMPRGGDTGRHEEIYRELSVHVRDLVETLTGVGED